MTPQGWAVTSPAFFGALPFPLRTLLPPLARRGMRKELQGHGLGRHAETEIEALGEADIDALAACLGDQPYFLGDEPHSVDACAYGFLANLYFVPVEFPITQHARRHGNLVRFTERMRDRYWP
jgi:glutathione S-transferase